MKPATIIPLVRFESTALPFKIQTIKSLAEELNEKNDAPHSHNYYEMVWMINGKANLYVDLREYVIGDNMIFCIMPNQAHQFQITEEMEGFIFSFTDSFFNIGEHDFEWTCQPSVFKLFFNCHVLPIQQEMEEDIKEVVLKMQKEFERQLPFREQLLQRYFKIFLIYLSRQLDENLGEMEQTRKVMLAKSFMEMLNKNFREEKTVAEYAAHLLVTPNYLNRAVKKVTGSSASHQIRQRLILEAKRMARFSDAGMKEIAYNLGFEDLAHFSKFFKVFSGINFSEFKKGGVIIPFEASLGRA